MASPTRPSPSLPRQRQEENPLKPVAPSSSSSLLSLLADRWRAYSSGSGATGSAAAASSSSPSKPNSSASSNPAAAGTTTDQTRPATHLCVLVHGLWGRPSDWDVVAERLDQHKRKLEGAEGGGGGAEGGGGGAEGAGGGREGRESLRVLKSRANARRLTLDGIDVCASRLAAEVRAAVAEERERFGEAARLERVSFVGHSMGGLIARAAVAELLDDADGADGADGAEGGKAGGRRAEPGGAPATTLAGGLSPAHFVSVATPHLGCHAEAEATAAFVAAARATAAAAAAAATAGATAAAAEEKEGRREDDDRPGRQHPALVPLVSWIAAAASPAAAASTMAPRLLAAAAARASASMGRSGPQFFLADGGEEEGEGDSRRRRRPPLLARLADPALPALRALAAFESRTTFANSSGDHLVGWGNASLRDPRELPRGELRAAAAAAAAARAAAAAAGGGEASPAEEEATGGGGWGGRLFSRRSGRKGAVVAKEGGVGIVLDDGVAAAFEHRAEGKGKPREEDKEAGGGRGGGAGAGEREVDRMLASLSSLPWRRVDACFKGTPTPFLAHNHIQATHFFNERVGRASADAIARAVVEADEELLRRRRRGRDKGSGEN